MKKLLFIILLSTGLIAQAQQKPNLSKGFWVIESNTASPKNQTVKFYNTNQQLLYQESYNLKILNCSKKRIRKILDGALTTVLNTNYTSKNSLLTNLIR
ncbi:MAG: hypothetical protein EOP42_17240 [Sphingobacteriaceae bacterium]|nr:MAG: hypothetical protein EOP42_17240 [Sphingobacteriaceae bacterium]